MKRDGLRAKKTAVRGRKFLSGSYAGDKFTDLGGEHCRRIVAIFRAVLSLRGATQTKGDLSRSL